METVKDRWLAGVQGEEGRDDDMEHRVFLGQKNSSVQHCGGGDT